MFKQRVDGILAAELFIYVNNRRPIGPNHTLFWEASRRWGSTCSWLGIQEAPRKVQSPQQAPGPWAGNINNNKEGVHGLVSQYIWDNTHRLIA